VPCQRSGREPTIHWVRDRSPIEVVIGDTSHACPRRLGRPVTAGPCAPFHARVPRPSAAARPMGAFLTYFLRVRRRGDVSSLRGRRSDHLFVHNRTRRSSGLALSRLRRRSLVSTRALPRPRRTLRKPGQRTSAWSRGGGALRLAQVRSNAGVPANWPDEEASARSVAFLGPSAARREEAQRFGRRPTRPKDRPTSSPESTWSAAGQLAARTLQKREFPRRPAPPEDAQRGHVRLGFGGPR